MREGQSFDSSGTKGFGLWARAVRAPSLSATGAPCIAVLLLGLLQGWEVSPLLAFFSVVGVLAVQISVNLLNDLEDLKRRIDVAGTLGGSGVMQEGLLEPSVVSRAALISLVVGVLCGAPAVFAHPELLWIVALSGVGALGYSHGPALKYRAIGDLAVLALCGPALTIGFSLAAFGRFDLLVVALGVAFGLAAVGILHVNNFQDMDNDKRAGAVTVARLLGVRGSRIYLVSVYALAVSIWPLVALSEGLPTLAVVVPCLGLIPAIWLTRRLWAASRDGLEGLKRPELHLVRFEAAKVHLAIGACVSFGLALSLLVS
jgi:1,4-dihydroxy-2-naphthoate octaprenyltransferase